MDRSQESIQDIAKVCHEANRAYCATIGDYSQKPWDEAEDWQKESAFDGVVSILTGNVKSPADAHEAWAVDKVHQGWVWGELKDAKANPPTHPCLVPYSELPATQQRKDALFFAIVNALK